MEKDTQENLKWLVGGANLDDKPIEEEDEEDAIEII